MWYKKKKRKKTERKQKRNQKCLILSTVNITMVDLMILFVYHYHLKKKLIKNLWSQPDVRFWMVRTLQHFGANIESQGGCRVVRRMYVCVHGTGHVRCLSRMLIAACNCCENHI